MILRSDQRRAEQLRPVTMHTGFTRNAAGSVLIEMGHTRVICTASPEESVPPFLKDSGRGWITAEYGMLPGSSATRVPREATRGRATGRTQEIQRLIGRSLRAVTDLEALGSRTIWIDCDVIEADGGTRTASITGAYVALLLALRSLAAKSLLPGNPVRDSVAAVSVGIVDGDILLDLAYAEDSRAEVDMNMVMTGNGEFVEIQGTAEAHPFTATQLERMTALARQAISELTMHQRRVLAGNGTPEP